MAIMGWNLLTKLVHKIIARQAEFISMLSAFWWTYVLLVPPPTFQVSPAYRMMAEFMPEFGWAVLTGILAVGHLVSFFQNSTGIRHVLSIIGVAVWSFIAALLWVTGASPTAPGIFFALSTALGVTTMWLTSQRR